MLVSIIIPTYNSGLTIKKTIESINFSENIELLIVDDGSSDNTLKILDSLKKKYSFKLISGGHKGAAKARNIGIKHAKGKYLLFLDSDDILDQEAFNSNIFNILNNSNYDVIDINQHIKEDDIASKTMKSIILLNNLGLSNKNETIWLSGPVSKFYKRSFILKYNILFDEHVQVGEDLIFNLIGIKKAKEIFLKKGKIYHIVENKNSITHTILNKDFFQDTINLINEVNYFISDSPILSTFIAKRYFMLYVQLIKSNCNPYIGYKKLDAFLKLYGSQMKNYDTKILKDAIGKGRFMLFSLILNYPKTSIWLTPIFRWILNS